MTNTDHIAEFTDPRLVAIYDTTCPLGPEKDFYLNLAAQLQAGTIIDLGCGTGLLTQELTRQGHHLIGAEPSSAMLERATRRFTGQDVTLIHGGAEALGTPAADLAIMTGHVAQFFLKDTDWHAALKHLHAALKPGGHLAFESRNPLPNPFSKWPTAVAPQQLHDPKAGPIQWWCQPGRLDGRRYAYELHYRFESTGETVTSHNELIFRPRAEIEASLTQAGFTVEHIYGGWDAHTFQFTDEEMIFVARRV